MDAAPQDPYLPPPVPTDNPPAPAAGKRRVRQTVFIWSVLIIAFAVIYEFLQSDVHPHPRAAPVEACGSHWASTLGPAAVLFAIVVVYILRLQRGSRGVPQEEAASLALIDGDFVAARDRYLEVARIRKSSATHAALSRANAAVASIRLGEFDRARDELLTAERTIGLLFGSGVRIWVSLLLARLFALRGELDRSRAWLESARQRLARNRGDRASFSSSAHMTEVLLLSRDGQDAEALRLLESKWRRFTYGHELTPALLLRAYLVTRTSGPRDGAAAQWIDALRTIGTPDAPHLWKAWPELESFAETHSLARAA